MIYRVRIVPQAQRDLEDMLHHIATNDVERALSFVDELRAKIQSLAERPYRFQKFGNYHRLVHAGYVVAFLVEKSTQVVTVVLVCEGHRDWQSVLREWKNI